MHCNIVLLDIINQVLNCTFITMNSEHQFYLQKLLLNQKSPESEKTQETQHSFSK